MNGKHRLLAISIGIVYLLFGGLKFFPSLSPAESIGINTVQALTFGLFSAKSCILLLALFEVSIGLLLLCKVCLKPAIWAAMFHMIMTFTPFVFFPGETFAMEYETLSLLGQYIIKNIVIISALVTIYPKSVNVDVELSYSSTSANVEAQAA
jgi:uncharacterized membrane protein YkgB